MYDDDDDDEDENMFTQNAVLSLAAANKNGL